MLACSLKERQRLETNYDEGSELIDPVNYLCSALMASNYSVIFMLNELSPLSLSDASNEKKGTSENKTHTHTKISESLIYYVVRIFASFHSTEERTSLKVVSLVSLKDFALILKAQEREREEKK